MTLSEAEKMRCIIHIDGYYLHPCCCVAKGRAEDIIERCTQHGLESMRRALYEEART